MDFKTQLLWALLIHLGIFSQLTLFVIFALSCFRASPRAVLREVIITRGWPALRAGFCLVNPKNMIYVLWIFGGIFAYCEKFVCFEGS